jgi:hypothetical protein
LTVLYIGQSMSSDKSLTKQFNTIIKKLGWHTTQVFFCISLYLYIKIKEYETNN